MKKIIIILLVVVVVIFAFSTLSSEQNLPQNEQGTTVLSENSGSDDTTAERSVFTEGEYIVQSENSIVNWAGKKPLIDGYINSGSIAVTDGSISVKSEAATGLFTIDMNTLSVSETPAKPGSESALEGHLKGERWFDVATHPTAEFRITKITPYEDTESSFVYEVIGELEMKGATDTLEFLATIYEDDESGIIHVWADLELDRTKWNITAGSESFFDNLADNVIDDMVALSFELVADKQ